jgi:hypothetical protein
LYGGSAAIPYGNLISPASGTTGVSSAPQILVFYAPADYSVVLQAANVSSYVKTTTTALPSPYQSDAPGLGQGTDGYFAVTVPALSASTTYTVGTLSDINTPCESEELVKFGSFTTRRAATGVKKRPERTQSEPLADGRPLQLMAAEHFCDGWRPFTCTALDISGDYRLVRRHLVGMVVECAYEVEERLLDLA